MAILTSEVKAYKSQTNDDTASNGGRINDALEVLDNVANNVFPDLTASDLSAGKDRWRKIHIRVEDDENGTLNAAGVYMREPSDGDTQLYMRKGDNVDTQGAPTFSDLFGTGTLNANVSAGASSFDVLVEDGTKILFRDTEEIVIRDGTNTEYHTISGTPSILGDVVTVTIAGTLANGYTAGSSYVGSIVPYGTVATSYSNVVETTTSGTFDEAQIAVPNIGSIYQQWTITFTSATAFRLDGDTLGVSVDTGNTSTTLSPTNPNTSTPYFTIPAAAWGGTWAIGETVVFRTNPATMPLWERQLTPAGSTVSAGQELDLEGKGQVAA